MPVINLAESGYVRADTGHAVVFIDLAPIGPDYLPGHAHADTLSFELSIGKRRVFVNSGTSMYGKEQERLRQRGTAAHNTVLIDGHNSSEVWAGFRVGRRARVTETVVDSSINGNIKIYGIHDGYRRLPGSPMHCRVWDIRPKEIFITDEVKGKGEHEIIVKYHMHPDFDVLCEDENLVSITNANGEAICKLGLVEGEGNLVITPSTYHPEFGCAIDNKIIEYQWNGNLPMCCKICINWTMH